MNVAAHATVYTNSGGTLSTISPFGSPDSTSYGEFFTAPGGALQSWTFYSDSVNTAGNLELVIANWTGTAATGPALYTSGTISDAGTSGEALTFSGINLALTSGQQYIAYMTVAGVSNPVQGAEIETSSTNVLSSGAAYDNSNGADPLTSGNNTWHIAGGQFNFSATFGPASVPEPAGMATLLFGLVGLGFIRRRRPL